MQIKTKIDLNSVKTDNPFFVHNLKIYPIKGEIGHNGFSVIEEGIRSGTLLIQDIHGVNEVAIHNLGSDPVIAIDGEELIGARQNRILNTDIYVEPQREYTVPVTCIEQHRWSGSLLFQEGGFTVTPSLRSTLAVTINESLDKRMGYIGNQALIWTQIDKTLKATRISSMTNSFHDIYKSLNTTIEELFEDFNTIPDAVGFISFINDEFIGADIFGANSIYQKFEKKLLKGYILDGYIRKYTRNRGVSFSPEEVLSIISETPCKVYKSPTIGEDLRGVKDRILIKAYIVEDNPIHISAFELQNVN